MQIKLCLLEHLPDSALDSLATAAGSERSDVRAIMRAAVEYERYATERYASSDDDPDSYASSDDDTDLPYDSANDDSANNDSAVGDSANEDSDAELLDEGEEYRVTNRGGGTGNGRGFGGEGPGNGRGFGAVGAGASDGSTGITLAQFAANDVAASQPHGGGADGSDGAARCSLVCTGDS